MNDYYSTEFTIEPYKEDSGDLLAGFLSEIGFESFEQTENGITAYIKANDYSESNLKELLEDFPINCEIKWKSEFIEGVDWNQEWEKNYFKPILIEGKCLIRSSFHEENHDCEYEILIDPKMAFGTGHHSTTYMMVSHLMQMDLEGKSIIDMGTGTGVLAILAKLRGAKSAIGIEIDEMAYENAIENASLNSVDIKLVNVDADSLKDLDQADLFLANINRNIILADLPSYARKIKKDGKLIISGFYETDIPLIEGAADRNGMKIVNKTMKDEWCSLVLKFND